MIYVYRSYKTWDHLEHLYQIIISYVLITDLISVKLTLIYILLTVTAHLIVHDIIDCKR